MAGSLGKIAQELGVSISTVSRALAGMSGVSERNRKKIIELAKVMGCEADPNASALRSGRGYGLGIIVPFHQTEIAAFRTHELFFAGRRVFGSVRISVRNENESIDQAIQRAVAERSRAIILSGGSGKPDPATRKILDEKRIACTCLDCIMDGLDCVEIDREAGTYQATRMLILSGCRNIVYFSNNTVSNPDARMRGIMRAYGSMGKSDTEIRIADFDEGDYEGGMKAAEKILRTQTVDGMFCYCDSMAIGALRALFKAGVKVPEDVKVIGFDDLPVSSMLPVSLTTVAHPVGELVKTAIEMTLQRLDDYGAQPRRVSLIPRLIVRESAPVFDHGLREKIFQMPHDGGAGGNSQPAVLPAIAESEGGSRK